MERKKTKQTNKMTNSVLPFQWTLINKTWQSTIVICAQQRKMWTVLDFGNRDQRRQQGFVIAETAIWRRAARAAGIFCAFICQSLWTRKLKWQKLGNDDNETLASVFVSLFIYYYSFTSKRLFHCKYKRKILLSTGIVA